VASGVANLAAAAERSASSAHQAIDRLSEAAQPAVSSAASGAHQLVDSLSGTSTQVAQKLEQTASRLKDAERHLVDSSSNYVRAHPFKSAGFVLAAGFLVSRLVSSRKSPTSRESAVQPAARSTDYDRSTTPEPW
jgi:ElaB/YqjD/DUF883 family membrane-anchored ribosome-binding protein